MNIERRLPRMVAGAVLACALVVLVLVALVQALGWYRFLPVLSGSMSPFIETGDIAVLQPVEAEELAVGDVVAFEAPTGDRQLMLHRVSEIVSPYPDLRIRTRGDANSTDDPWTVGVADETLWRATDRIPTVGQPVVFASQVGARTVVFMAAAAICLILAIRRLRDLEGEELDEEEHLVVRTDDGRLVVVRPPVRRHPVESIGTLIVVGAVAVAALGLIVARPARATFTASTEEEQRISFTAASIPDALAAPTALQARIVCDLTGAPTGVDLTWVAPTPPSDSIRIERSSTSLLGDVEPFIELAAVGGNVTQFQDDFATVDPPPSNPLSVQYRVVSVANDGRRSAYSNVATPDVCVPDTPATTTTTVPVTTTTVPVTTTVVLGPALT